MITDSGDATHYIFGIHTHDVAAGIEENTYTFSGVTVGLNDDGVRHHVFTDHLATVTGTLEYGLGVVNVERLRSFGIGATAIMTASGNVMFEDGVGPTLVTRTGAVAK